MELKRRRDVNLPLTERKKIQRNNLRKVKEDEGKCKSR